MISFEQKGDFKSTESFLKRLLNRNRLYRNLNKFGHQGVAALASATPKDSGLTANSWDYEIKIDDRQSAIYWTNSNVNKGARVAILIQYGHGTGTGGYVQGIDYINPALRGVFESIAEDVWREVTNSG